MKILLLGGSGYVGRAFRAHLARRGLEYTIVSRHDYYDPARLDVMVRETRPNFLINAAGLAGRPNVDACEYTKSECP